MAKRKKDMSGVKNALKLSGLGAPLRTLIDAIYEGTDEITVFNIGKKVSYFFNHGYDKDPATNGGSLTTGTKVLIYYQPATQTEYDNWEVIDKAEGFLSGRRRLAVRIDPGSHPSYIDTYSFYLTNHPKEKPGLRTNVYGQFTPVDPAK